MKFRNFIPAICFITILGTTSCGDNDENDPQLPQEPEVKVESITLSEDTVRLEIGDSIQLTATVKPDNAPDIILWTTDNENVASVNSSGVVTAVASGDAIIMASAGEMSASCVVIVNRPVEIEVVTLDRTELTLEPSDTAHLSARIFPEEATDSLFWNSSDNTVATVDSTGIVTAIKPGNAIITVRAGEQSANCNVTVIPPFIAPKIGDYYYSDGSWSTYVDAGKMIIGVVFWTGDPTASDTKLKADHPGCTHGLVVGLEQIQTPWQANYEACDYTVSEWVEKNVSGYTLPRSGNGDSDPIQKITGYNNTHAIEQYNSASENKDWPVNVVEYAVKMRKEIPAPINSSDWYIPSPKELSLLCAGEIDGSIIIRTPVMTNMKLINSRIAAIGKLQINEITLWSSTENYIEGNKMACETAWNYYFEELNRPLSYSFKSWDEYARVRCVLAF